MGNIPVIHEVGTACRSAGHAVTGSPEKARAVWTEYADESVIGSGVYSAVLATKGEKEKAKKVAKGCGRAIGQAALGGGLLRDVPVFKELSKCGKSLGDVIGGGDTKKAGERWTKEYLEEIRDPDRFKKAFVSVGVTAAAVGVTVLSAGLATPAFVGVAATSGAVAGTVESTAKQHIDVVAGKQQSIEFGEVLGAAGAGAAIGGAFAGVARAIGGQPTSSPAKGFPQAPKGTGNGPNLVMPDAKPSPYAGPNGLVALDGLPQPIASGFPPAPKGMGTGPNLVLNVNPSPFAGSNGLVALDGLPQPIAPGFPAAPVGVGTGPNLVLSNVKPSSLAGPNGLVTLDSLVELGSQPISEMNASSPHTSAPGSGLTGTNSVGESSLSSLPSITYSDGVGSFIDKQSTITVYRGCTNLVENPLHAPPLGAGTGGATLGPGSYWSDSLLQAEAYALKCGGSVWKHEFSLNDLVGQDLSVYLSAVDDLGATTFGPRAPVVNYYDVVSSLHHGFRQWRFNAIACERMVGQPVRA